MDSVKMRMSKFFTTKKIRALIIQKHDSSNTQMKARYNIITKNEEERSTENETTDSGHRVRHCIAERCRDGLYRIQRKAKELRMKNSTGKIPASMKER